MKENRWIALGNVGKRSRGERALLTMFEQLFRIDVMRGSKRKQEQLARAKQSNSSLSSFITC